MTEKEYLTLKQISNELKINYKTLVSCKHRLKDFVQGYAVGRTAKYDPDMLDFFRMVFALLDEGYQTDEIIKLLNNGVISDKELFIKEWLYIWRDKLGITKGNNSDISMEDERMTDTPTDGPDGGPTELPIDSLDGSATDQLTDPATDRLTDLKQEILSTIPDMIKNQVETLSTYDEANLSPQINSAITQIYKVATQLQEEINSLHIRVKYLEKELGADPWPDFDLLEMDLEKMQVKNEKPEPAMQHATLDFLKASISDGKPDKQAVVQWIKAERERSPGLSYTDLAEMLDSAGVPTLRGGIGWHRGTIRNLSVK